MELATKPKGIPSRHPAEAVAVCNKHVGRRSRGKRRKIILIKLSS